MLVRPQIFWVLVVTTTLHVAPARADGATFAFQAGFTKLALEGFDSIDGTGPSLRAQAGWLVRRGFAIAGYGRYQQASAVEWLDPGEADYAVRQVEVGAALELRASRLTFAVTGGFAYQHEQYSYDEDGWGINSAGTRSHYGSAFGVRIGVDVARFATWRVQILGELETMSLSGTRAPQTNSYGELVDAHTTESGTASTLAIGVAY